MTGISAGANTAIANHFPWERYDTFIDIGTAEGHLPVTVARTHPHIRGGGYDLPAVQPGFEKFVESAGLADRLAFYPGDFFEDDKLPTADVLAMGHILHDWGLDTKRKLLDKVYHSLPEGGALIVYGSVIDDERRSNTFGLLMSLNMPSRPRRVSTTPARTVAAGCERPASVTPTSSHWSALIPWSWV